MAINFPSTQGQPIDGTFTYVVSGITYSWNGESWRAAGGGATATDLTVFSVTNNAASGGGSLAYNSNTGDFSYTPPDLSSYLTLYGPVSNHSDVTITNPQADQVLRYNASNLAWENTDLSVTVDSLSDTDLLNIQDGDILRWNSTSSKWINTVNSADLVSTLSTAYFGVGDPGTGTPSIVQIEGIGPGGALELSNGGSPVAISFNYNTGTAGQVITATGDDGFGNATGADWSTPGTPLQSRTTSQITAASLPDGSDAAVSITTPPAYALLKIETSHAAWVTLYTDTTSRTNDAGRSETTDPTPGSGVIAEVITAGATTQLISPGTIAYNANATGTTYAKVVNKSGATANITVTLTYIQLEA
tara:strand:+ start:4072 stop:5154 length:1083 start_codon:yes stop_codon:yes gene_type:complete